MRVSGYKQTHTSKHTDMPNSARWALRRAWYGHAASSIVAAGLLSASTPACKVPVQHDRSRLPHRTSQPGCRCRRRSSLSKGALARSLLRAEPRRLPCSRTSTRWAACHDRLARVLRPDPFRCRCSTVACWWKEPNKCGRVFRCPKAFRRFSGLATAPYNRPWLSVSS